MAKFEIIDGNWIKQIENYDSHGKPINIAIEQYKYLKISAVMSFGNQFRENEAHIFIASEKHYIHMYYTDKELELYHKEWGIIKNLLISSK